MGNIDTLIRKPELGGTFRLMLEDCHLSFWRYFFKHQTGSKAIINAHHKIIADTLDKVFTGEITRLVINLSPGYTKTMLAVISFIAHGLALNPRAKFIHTSYSDSLAMENSTLSRDIVKSAEFQQLWPMALRQDKDAKSSWFNDQGGGLYSASSRGQITGHRAGYADDGFTGAFIIDDPIKPDDAFSDKIRGDINKRITNTFKSRLMNEDVPIILIMQRIHADDPTAFLLQGGTGEKWHYLKIPVLLNDDSRTISRHFTHAIPIEYDLPDGPLWPYKHDTEQIKALQADPYTFASQYQQEPDAMQSGMCKREWFGWYDTVPPTISLFTMYADTAMKTGQHNDYSVFGLFGTAYHEGRDRLFVLHIERGKWEAHELREKAAELWLRFQNVGGRMGVSAFKIEDKASGTGLIQDCKRGIDYQGKKVFIAAEEISRTTDKVSRMNASIPQLASGNVLLPSQATPLTDALWVSDFIDEITRFSATMTHKNDDQTDVLNDAIQDLLINDNQLFVV